MRWLLRLLTDDADRRAIESDLAELYEFRRRQARHAAPIDGCAGNTWPIPGIFSSTAVVRPIPRATTMPHLWRDIRYSLRSLAHVPALSATIVLTVGIGLGATSAMIGLVRAVLVDPLPYAHSEELVWIYTDTPPYWFRLSVVDYRALEADHPTFSGVAAYQTNFVTVSGRGSTERVAMKEVTGSYFPLLGQRAQIGRLFDRSDDKRDERTVVLTDAFWARRFARDRGVVGQPLSIDGAPHTIVGVLERAGGPLEHDIGLFATAQWPVPTRKGPFFTTVLARMYAWRVAGRGPFRAARHEQAALSGLAFVVSGRESDVGIPGPQGPCRRRDRHDAQRGARRRGLRSAHRLRKCGEPSHRPRPAAQPRDDHPGCARRFARPPGPAPIGRGCRADGCRLGGGARRRRGLAAAGGNLWRRLCAADRRSADERRRDLVARRLVAGKRRGHRPDTRAARIPV